MLEFLFGLEEHGPRLTAYLHNLAKAQAKSAIAIHSMFIIPRVSKNQPERKPHIWQTYTHFPVFPPKTYYGINASLVRCKKSRIFSLSAVQGVL